MEFEKKKSEKKQAGHRRKMVDPSWMLTREKGNIRQYFYKDPTTNKEILHSFKVENTENQYYPADIRFHVLPNGTKIVEQETYYIKGFIGYPNSNHDNNNIAAQISYYTNTKTRVKRESKCYWMGKLHRNPARGPAHTTWYPSGNKHEDRFYVDGVMQNIDGKASYIEYYDTEPSVKKSEKWLVGNQFDRPALKNEKPKPTEIEYHANGKVKSESWKDRNGDYFSPGKGYDVATEYDENGERIRFASLQPNGKVKWKRKTPNSVSQPAVAGPSSAVGSRKRTQSDATGGEPLLLLEHRSTSPPRIDREEFMKVASPTKAVMPPIKRRKQQHRGGSSSSSSTKQEKRKKPLSNTTVASEFVDSDVCHYCNTLYMLTPDKVGSMYESGTDLDHVILKEYLYFHREIVGKDADVANHNLTAFFNYIQSRCYLLYLTPNDKYVKFVQDALLPQSGVLIFKGVPSKSEFYFVVNMNDKEKHKNRVNYMRVREGNLTVEYADEIGYDMGGVKRNFITKLVRQIHVLFDEIGPYGRFHISDKPDSVIIGRLNAVSGRQFPPNQDIAVLYEWAGRIIGFSFINNNPVGLNLSSFLLSFMSWGKTEFRLDFPNLSDEEELRKKKSFSLYAEYVLDYGFDNAFATLYHQLTDYGSKTETGADLWVTENVMDSLYESALKEYIGFEGEAKPPSPENKEAMEEYENLHISMKLKRTPRQIRIERFLTGFFDTVDDPDVFGNNIGSYHCSPTEIASVLCVNPNPANPEEFLEFLNGEKVEFKKDKKDFKFEDNEITKVKDAFYSVAQERFDADPSGKIFDEYMMIVMFLWTGFWFFRDDFTYKFAKHDETVNPKFVQSTCSKCFSFPSAVFKPDYPVPLKELFNFRKSDFETDFQGA